jgi:transcriptional regulator with PAS, ATPase and Fis domain
MTMIEAPRRDSRYTLLGTSASVAQLRLDIASAATSDAKVLLTGETGVGKEVVAHSIHQLSRRCGGPFVTINCAGVPDTLLESEFFGHTKGSFTGAFRDNPGLLRQAHGGTVFLDEIGEMSLRMQALLLRFLETGELQTVGAGVSTTSVDVRVIAATHRDLLASVQAREFRADLYYRLDVFHLHIPPLRERPDDVELLLDHYVRMFAEHQRCPVPQFSPASLDLLRRYPWPGNIRELRNLTERIVSRGPAAIIEPAHLPKNVHDAVEVERSRAQMDQRNSGVHEARVQRLIDLLMVKRESFWTTAYPAFMSHDIVREDMRRLIQVGLDQSRGSYRVLLGLFNIPPPDYKRFLGFLKQHDCHLPFQRFRAIKGSPPITKSGRLDS